MGALEDFVYMVSHILGYSNRWKWRRLTVQNIQLTSTILTGDLQTTSINEVEDDAVGEFLRLHLGGVRRTEVAEMIPLDSPRLEMLVPRHSNNGYRHGGRHTLHGTQNEESLAVEAHGPALPE